MIMPSIEAFSSLILKSVSLPLNSNYVSVFQCVDIRILYVIVISCLGVLQQ